MGDQITNGWWSEADQENHINFLELLAIYYGLKCFARTVKDVHILIRIDNTTAISHINKIGGI